MEFIKPEWVSVRNHPELNERWVQDHIAEDPSILGLGNLILKDRERMQPRAGRLDLLLEDADSSRRYEVELQLGTTDESHIIRTIEYWDIERKRYPQYDHCAVIVAEDITGRFLNVISLFNGTIPIIAVQMKALKLGDQIALVFTTVLDEMTLGLDDEESADATDRAYWETTRGTPQTVALADGLLSLIRQFAPGLELKYNKFYIGLAKGGQPSNFVIFRARKNYLRLEPRLRQSDEVQAMLTEAGLELMDYDARWRRYRIRLGKGDVEQHNELLTKLMQMAYEAAG